jgi:hypothetical protein
MTSIHYSQNHKNKSRRVFRHQLQLDLLQLLSSVATHHHHQSIIINLHMLVSSSSSIRLLQFSYLLATSARVSTAAFITPRTTFTLSSNKRLFATTTTTIMSSSTILARVTPDNVSLEIKDPVDAMALEQAKAILAEIRPNNAPQVDATKLMEVGMRLGDLKEGAPLIISKEACQAAFEGLTDTERTALVNIHDRVKTFAEAQRKAVVDMEIDIPGGKAGHTVSPCKGKLVLLLCICRYHE